MKFKARTSTHCRRPGPFVAPSLRVEKVIGGQQWKTWSRATTIVEAFVGRTFHVHNGKTFTAVLIQPEMVGCKLGEFSRTRRRGKDPRPKTSARKNK